MNEEALLIGRDELVKFTAVNGNVDTDKFIQFIKIAQDIHIQNYLGTKLLRKIQADIIAGTLTGAYKDLTIKYIQPMLIHWALYEYLPFSAYTIANKGVYKHTSENSDSVDRTEISLLMEKQRDIAENYTSRFIDYMCFHTTTFPEYLTGKNEDVQPSTKNNFSGWYL
jgi:hypothetical protein